MRGSRRYSVTLTFSGSLCSFGSGLTGFFRYVTNTAVCTGCSRRTKGVPTSNSFRAFTAATSALFVHRAVIPSGRLLVQSLPENDKTNDTRLLLRIRSSPTSDAY